jgi:outer membrane lipoprotein-sorting protein
MPWKRAPNCATGPLVRSFNISQRSIQLSLRAGSRAAYNETMPIRRLALSILVLCLICAATSSCIGRRRLMSRAVNSKPLLVADLPTLLAAVKKQYDAIQNFSASVDMVPALGSTEKNQITEYKDVRAYIRFRKPSNFRLIGLLPVVRSTMFDMVSDGADFKLYIPSKGRFIVGRNAIDQLSPNKLENLRPQHFLDALVVQPLDTKTDKVMLQNLTDEDNAYYIVHEVHELLDGALQLRRTIWFSRIDMTMARQMIFDEAGNPLTDARYSEWHLYDNVPFPKHIEINRPRDEYAIVLDVVKMDINKGVASDQFVLDQPEGTTLQTVGPPPAKGPQK